MRIQAHDLAIEIAAAALQVTRQSVAQARETLERVPVARNQPHTIAIRIEQRTKALPLDLENPIGMVERLALRLAEPAVTG